VGELFKKFGPYKTTTNNNRVVRKRENKQRKNMIVIEILVYLVAFAALVYFGMYALATKDIFWTQLETGNIKYIFRGDKLHKIIADVRNKKMDDTMGHKLETGVEHRSWLNNKTGLYWIGWPPFASVHKFKIRKRKEVEITTGKPPAGWIEDFGEVIVSSLRETFTLPFVLTEVELNDQQNVSMLVVAKFDVVDAYIPVIELKGGFFANTSSTLSAAVTDIAKELTMDGFVAAPKGEKVGILSVEFENKIAPDETVTISKFNKRLEEQVGLHLVGVAISEWDPSDKAIRDAMSKKFLAEKEQAAAVIKAETYAKEVAIKTTADVGRVVALGEADGKRVLSTVNALGGNVTVAGKLLEMEAAAGPNSKLTTLVNGPATPVVPVGGGK